MKGTFGQLLRYGFVGVVSNLIGFLLYLIMTGAGVSPKLAMTLLYILGIAQSFVFNRRWSFRHIGQHGPAFIRYCLAYGFGYFINLIALMLFVDHLMYPHQIVQGVLIAFLAFVLFLLQKYWVFRVSIVKPASSGLKL